MRKNKRLNRVGVFCKRVGEDYGINREAAACNVHSKMNVLEDVNHKNLINSRISTLEPF